jgi:Flp pilus assembly protein TadD
MSMAIAVGIYTTSAASQDALPHTPAATLPSPRVDIDTAYAAALRAQQADQGTEALRQLDQALLAHPTDLRLRFLRGVVLSGMARTSEAIAVFESLTESFPELPEPHNNLAVLRANQGNLQGARHALEAALRVAPDYSVAHENLGDLSIHLAQQAYQRALQLEPQRAVLARKLDLLNQLQTLTSFSSTSRSGAQPQAVSE